jgi:hypothetical protein
MFRSYHIHSSQEFPSLCIACELDKSLLEWSIPVIILRALLINVFSWLKLLSWGKHSILYHGQTKANRTQPAYIGHAIVHITKQLKLKLKTQP